MSRTLAELNFVIFQVLNFPDETARNAEVEMQGRRNGFYRGVELIYDLG